MQKPSNPLVILGYDAADPGILLDLSKQGRLQVLPKLMKNGVWGKTGGPEMMFAHGVWLTLLSGISRTKHGYYYFRQLKPGSYDLTHVIGRDIPALPFWANLRGVKAAVIDVPDNYPMPHLDGIQLCNWTTHDSNSPAEALPNNLMAEYQRLFGERFFVKDRIHTTPAKDLKTLSLLMERIKRKGDLACELVSKDRYDLIACIFPDSHIATHQFWKYRHGNDEKLSSAIPEIYAAIDKQMARILETLPKNANVIMLTSTGMEDKYPYSDLMESFCLQLGYQRLKSYKARPKRFIDFMRQFFPEKWRIEVSKRILTMQQRESLLVDKFSNYSDWSQTKAFVIPSLYNSLFRINLKGREPQGIVSAGEYDSLLDQIDNDVRMLRDAETNEALVKTTHRITKLFGIQPSELLPDLVVQWKPIPRLLRKVRHPRAVLRQDKPEFFRGTDHTTEGFFAAAGPSISGRGDKGLVSPLVFAPEFLRLLGQPVQAMERAGALLS